MGRIEEAIDTVKRCKSCLIPLGFKYARGVKDLCWECGSTETDAEVREKIANLVMSDEMTVACDYCGDIYCQDDIQAHTMPDDSKVTSCWPCAADCAQQIKYEMQYFPYDDRHE